VSDGGEMLGELAVTKGLGVTVVSYGYQISGIQSFHDAKLAIESALFRWDNGEAEVILRVLTKVNMVESFEDDVWSAHVNTTVNGVPVIGMIMEKKSASLGIRRSNLKLKFTSVFNHYIRRPYLNIDGIYLSWFDLLHVGR